MRAESAAVLATALVTGLAAPARAQSAEPPPPPVSLIRIHEGLQKPQTLDLPGRRPTFSISVTETLSYDNPFGVEKAVDKTWADVINAKVGTGIAPVIALSAVAASMAGDGSMSARPVMLMNMLAIGQYVAGKVGRKLQERKVRTTRERVQSELAEFCAAHGCQTPESGSR